MTLDEQAKAVETKNDLVALLIALAADYRENPDALQSTDLPSFLRAMAAWAQDMDGYYRNAGQDLSKRSVWGLAADLLMAGRVYE